MRGRNLCRLRDYHGPGSLASLLLYRLFWAARNGHRGINASARNRTGLGAFRGPRGFGFSSLRSNLLENILPYQLFASVVFRVPLNFALPRPAIPPPRPNPSPPP